MTLAVDLGRKATNQTKEKASGYGAMQKDIAFTMFCKALKLKTIIRQKFSSHPPIAFFSMIISQKKWKDVTPANYGFAQN